MANKFETIVNSIPNKNVQEMLRAKYKEDIKAAQAALDTWKVVMEELDAKFGKLNQNIDSLIKALTNTSSNLANTQTAIGTHKNSIDENTKRLRQLAGIVGSEQDKN